MGSKARYAKYIAPVLQRLINENNIEVYIEPFVGGANMIDKIKCPIRIGSDLSESVITLLNAAKSGMLGIPVDGSRELWDIAKNNSIGASAIEKSAIEWLGSYNARGFPGGYAKASETRNHYGERYKNLAKQAPALADIDFLVRDYQEYSSLIDDRKTLIYCDPPYLGTKPYGVNKGFNHDDFWSWAKGISTKAIVLISEESIPLNLEEDEYSVLWSKEVKRTIGGKSIPVQENLIIIGESK